MGGQHNKDTPLEHQRRVRSLSSARRPTGRRWTPPPRAAGSSRNSRVMYSQAQRLVRPGLADPLQQFGVHARLGLARLRVAALPLVPNGVTERVEVEHLAKLAAHDQGAHVGQRVHAGHVAGLRREPARHVEQERDRAPLPLGPR